MTLSRPSAPRRCKGHAPGQRREAVTRHRASDREEIEKDAKIQGHEECHQQQVDSVYQQLTDPDSDTGMNLATISAYYQYMLDSNMIRP